MDPWALAVTPRRFKQHLEILRQDFNLMQLGQLPRALRESKVPDRSVIVTFDDGYADNLFNAKPLLERYHVPATIFLSSGFIGREHEFWWDELVRLLLRPGTLPKSLSLRVGGDRFRWQLADAARYPRAEFRRYRNWSAWKEAPTPRHSLYQALWQQLHPMDEDERESVLDQLRAWANGGSSGSRANRSLSREEAVSLAQGEWVEIGAHTVTHPSLAALPLASQRDEILNSKSRLENLLSRPVVSFSYPFGKQSDYSADTINLVRQGGFVCACSNLTGVIEQRSDPFELPRVHVPNLRREGFAKMLHTWFDA